MNANDPVFPGGSSRPSRREHCARCLRAQSTCICRWIRPAAHDTEVLILQHPQEVHEAKGSGRLLHLSLPNSRLAVGEVFDEAALFAGSARKRNLLLYPSAPGADGGKTPSSLQPADWQDPAGLRLIVLDATWRKSRKMLYLNPWLLALPRLPLEDLPASRYLIRKAHKKGQLSTLEATCAALAQLRGDQPPLRPLLDAFDGFVAQQLAFRTGRAGARDPVSRPDR